MTRLFTVQKFSTRKTRINVPALYTNIPGYKFHIGIDPIGGWTCVDKAMLLQLYVRQGEYDDQLLWPAKANFTLELVNQNNRGNIKCELLKEWEKPSQAEAILGAFHRLQVNGCNAFMKLCNIDDFLHNDSLHFRLTVEVISHLMV